MFPTKIFENKHILVGIIGGVAAYKTCEIIRYLVTQGADVRIGKISAQKLKKRAGDFVIKTKRTPDILRKMAKRKKANQKFIGFAVETETPKKNARKKLISKKLDVIVINNPLTEGAAFAGDTNVVTLLDETRKESLKIAYKLDVSQKIFEFLLE